MGLWVLGFGIYESHPLIAHANEQTTTSKLVKTTLTSGTNIYWYDGSVKLPVIYGGNLTNPVVTHFGVGQSDVGIKNVMITVDPTENTSYTFSNQLDDDGKITLQGKVIVGDITVKYVDTDGNEIAASTKADHSDDSSDSNYLNYTTKQLNIDGYTFVKMDDTSLPANGTLSGTGGNVIYVYRSDNVGDDNTNAVTDSKSSNDSNIADSKSTTNNDNVTDNSDNSLQENESSDSNTSLDSNDSSNLLKNSNSGFNSSSQLPSSGLLRQPTTSNESGSDNHKSKTISQSSADQGKVPKSNTDYYITLASFTLVSAIGLVGIEIIKH